MISRKDNRYNINKAKSKKYHTVGTVPKSNIKIVERVKIDTTAHKYMHFNKK